MNTTLTDDLNIKAMHITTEAEQLIIKERMDLWRNKKL